MTDRKKFTEADLRNFTGSEHWYRHGLVRTILFTDGAKYVADEGGAYWLLDEIAFAQKGEKAVAGEGVTTRSVQNRTLSQKQSKFSGFRKRTFMNGFRLSGKS